MDEGHIYVNIMYMDDTRPTKQEEKIPWTDWIPRESIILFDFELTATNRLRLCVCVCVCACMCVCVCVCVCVSEPGVSTLLMGESLIFLVR